MSWLGEPYASAWGCPCLVNLWPLGSGKSVFGLIGLLLGCVGFGSPDLVWVLFGLWFGFLGHLFVVNGLSLFLDVLLLVSDIYQRQ